MRIEFELKAAIVSFPNSVSEIFGHFGGIVLEEVEVHYLGDAEQEGGVEGDFVEDLIDVVTSAWNLAGQPAYAAFVASELRLNEVPDVQGLWLCLI